VSTKADSDTGRAPVVRFKIRLLFRHPAIDPESITKTLGIPPSVQARAGDPARPGVDGTPRRGTEPLSAWSVQTSFRDDDPDDERGPNVDDCLSAFLEPLLPHAAFVRRLAGGCSTATVILQFPGGSHYGGDLSTAVLRKITDLGLKLGVEIFPNMRT
jgi:hypothetical protein